MSSEELKNLNKMMEESSQKLGEVLAEKFANAREANQETIKTMEKLALTVSRVATFSRETRDILLSLEETVVILEKDMIEVKRSIQRLESRTSGMEVIGQSIRL